MTDNEMFSRMETLESRLMHQEAAIEEMTRTLLSQERLLVKQASAISKLETLVNALTSHDIALPEDETPPPHY
jgi:SlyX protein